MYAKLLINMCFLVFEDVSKTVDSVAQSYFVYVYTGLQYF